MVMYKLKGSVDFSSLNGCIVDARGQVVKRPCFIDKQRDPGGRAYMMLLSERDREMGQTG